MKNIGLHRIFGFQPRAATITVTFAVVIAAAVFVVHSVGAARAAQAAPTPALTTLYTFTGGGDGAEPLDTLIEDAQGDLYGTTATGGSSVGQAGHGVVFELSQAGNETVLYTFADGADGGNPSAGLLMDAKGDLYGTTQAGGNVSKNCNGNGCGVVFRLSPPEVQGMPWAETVLHTFTGGADGGEPFAGLITDGAGNLYGTTFVGGSQTAGVVFKINNSRKESVLYNFCSLQYCQDGQLPQAGLMRDEQGNLYGTATSGGMNDQYGDPGPGVIFKLDPAGNETVLYALPLYGHTGAYPVAGLIQDQDGNFYGTTNEGGSHCRNSGCGVVFRLPSGGKYNVMYEFKGGTDGSLPEYGSLMRDANGDLYGTTYAGGGGSCTDNNDLMGCGTIFRVIGAGKQSVVYAFQAQGDGAHPTGGLTRDRTGKVLGYGTTAGTYNGVNGYGTVFQVARQ